ncbi:MAG: TIGR03118 family protein [bacterium]
MKTHVALKTLGLTATIALTLAGCGGSSTSGSGAVTPTNQFVMAKLVADTAGAGAAHTDANFVNPWGLAFSPTGEFWSANNGTGTSSLFDSTGAIVGTTVAVPGATAGSNGAPTGAVYNGSSDFAIGGIYPAQFMFCSPLGLITGWWNGATASVVADQSASHAAYLGLAIGSVGANRYIYATNFASGGIDVFDKSFTKTPMAFIDPTMPAGFAPFGIENLGGQIYVTYAKVNTTTHHDDPGPGNGYVSVFNTDGTFVKRFASQGALNSPWGLAMAPGGIGAYSNAILVGNFGDGKINAYDSSGAYLGALNDTTGNPIVIDGLWAIKFGNGALAGSTTKLYFTAGPSSETHGLFGSLTYQP